MYTYYCIEEEIIGRTLSHKDSKDGSHGQYWKNEDHDFNYQLYQWGVDKLFQNSYEVIIRELKVYIEDWGDFM